MKNSLKELCHKNNRCGVTDIYVIQQGAVQAKKKRIVILCTVHAVWMDTKFKVGLT